MTLDDFNAIAWRDFVLFAWAEPNIRAQFTAATGLRVTPATSPIDVLVDDATGATASVLTKFVEWVTREHWGIEHAPLAYQHAIANKEAKT